MDELTTTERRAIADLKGIAKRWPASLWLFSANGQLHVMRFDSLGKRVVTPEGSMDPRAIVATVEGIEVDGGDW